MSFLTSVLGVITISITAAVGVIGVLWGLSWLIRRGYSAYRRWYIVSAQMYDTSAAFGSFHHLSRPDERHGLISLMLDLAPMYDLRVLSALQYSADGHRVSARSMAECVAGDSTVRLKFDAAATAIVVLNSRNDLRTHVIILRWNRRTGFMVYEYLYILSEGKRIATNMRVRILDDSRAIELQSQVDPRATIGLIPFDRIDEIAALHQAYKQGLLSHPFVELLACQSANNARRLEDLLSERQLTGDRDL